MGAETVNRENGFISRLKRVFDRFTDWLLIGIGLALIVKASLAVDVPLARYGIIGIGAMLAGIGFYYRHRRKRRYR